MQLSLEQINKYLVAIQATKSHYSVTNIKFDEDGVGWTEVYSDRNVIRWCVYSDLHRET